MNNDQTHNMPRPRQTRALQRLKVIVRAGPDAGATFEPPLQGPVSIGTSSDNAVVLHDPTVSRYHLELHRLDDGIGVVDLGSSNGTLFGGARIERAVLPAPATLRLGETVIELVDGELDVTEPPDEEAEPIPALVGKSASIRRITAELARLSGSMVPVLVQGETGTGKELVSRALHDLGPRKDRPFVVVDCGSLPPTLIASELFGHERGAFTGADHRHIGAFERARGGTVLLDEIGEMPLAVQPSLLGVLERKRFRRVGGSEDISTDVRVVAATHRDLRAEVNRGGFRADLYFRLAVARLVLPPLRERREDIPELVAHFTREATGDEQSAPFGRAAMESLMNHPWSGNVRELRNVVESALALGKLNLESEGPPASHAAAPAPPAGEEPAPRVEPIELPATHSYRDARGAALKSFETAFLRRLMDAADGNVSKAARLAQMDRPYLLTLLKKNGMR